MSRLVMGLALGLATSCALDDSGVLDEPGGEAAAAGAPAEAGDASGDAMQALCTQGRFRCHAYIRTGPSGVRFTPYAADEQPDGLGAQDLQSAYKINPSVTATASPTVAVTLAYGYTTLEADLAVYRTQYGLPPCTIASGCLRIVNQDGQSSPLPPNPPPEDDWRVETALDIDMVSAACPLCKILVVQADDNSGPGLLLAQRTAARLGATVISNSWGAPEQPAEILFQMEAFFDQPNVATFVSSGDHGYNDQFNDVTGPDYPGTSAHVISVGGTRLVRDATTARGWRETTWAPVPGDPSRGAGGSACSESVPKPAYQTQSPCAFRASTDIAAVGDPVTGVAVYTSAVGANGGWVVLGGTSASSPFVAAIFAATGHGQRMSGEFLASNANRLFDVTSGNNGTCGSQTILCNAGTGWDGPTGYGTPNASLFMPTTAMPGGGGGSGSGGGDGDDEIVGGCAAGGGAGWGALAALALAMLGARRRRG